MRPIGMGGPSVYVLLLLVNEHRTSLSLWQGRTELGRKTKLNAGKKKDGAREKPWSHHQSQTCQNFASKPMPCGDIPIHRNGLN